MPFNILIVDDEPLIRSDVRSMLEEFNDIAVVGEASNVDSAIAFLNGNDISPDAVFLDIQMPGKLGFELLPYLPEKTHVVFVTAFDEYAVRAFEVNSLDYLLKPVAPNRLSKTLERLRHRDKQADTPPNCYPRLTLSDQLYVRSGRHFKFINLSDVRFFRADDIYIDIVLSEKEKYLDNHSLEYWQKLLPPEFITVHRSFIVNTKHIESIHQSPNGLYQLLLTMCSKMVPVSRRQKQNLKAFLRSFRSMNQ